MYLQGKLTDLPAKLYESAPKNDEERAMQTYLNAMLKPTKDDTLILLQQAIDRYPSTYYGQMSMLEKARIHILERLIPEAEAQLKKINSPDIKERFYWLAYCAQSKDDHATAIAQGENYLRADPAGKYAEDTHYMIASAYQNQKKYQSGISTLEKLRALPGLPKNQQYFHYLLGRLHQLNGTYIEAYQNYKAGFILNRRSQLAFELEDLLFELKSRHGSAIDLAFMYPYTALDLPELEPAAVEIPSVAVVEPQSTPKLSAKPSGGYFVQTGRFGSEANAGKRTAEVRALNLKANYFEDTSNKTVPWVVISGPYASQNEADTVLQILRRNSIDCFITRF